MHQGHAVARFPGRRPIRTAAPVLAISSPCRSAGVYAYDLDVVVVVVVVVVESCDVERWTIVAGMAAEDELQNDVPTEAAPADGHAHRLGIDSAVLRDSHHTLRDASAVVVNSPAHRLKHLSNLPRRHVASRADRRHLESCAGDAEFAASDVDCTAGFVSPPGRGSDC